MMTHIVVFWLDEGAHAQGRKLLEAALSLKTIPGVLNFRAGPPLPSPREVVDDSFAVALAMDFADAEAAEAYQNHPVHQDFVRDHVRGRVKRLVVYDFES